MLKMANADTCIFTFIWTIENISELTYIDLESPSFVIKSIGNTKWFMKISEHTGFCCEIQANDSSGKVRDGIGFEFSFLDADGSPLISKKSRGPKFCFSLFTIDAFFRKWAEFMPNNVLTIQCRMWEKENKMPTTDLCIARTKLRTHRGTFLWAIEEFSALKSSAVEDFRELATTEKKVYPLKPLMEKGPYMALILYLKNRSESEDVYVNFLIEKGRDYIFSCEISALDANGKVITSRVERGRTHFEWTVFEFRSFISKNKLIGNTSLFLPNNTLHLRCSFEVCTGEISSQIEFCTQNVLPVVEEKEVIDSNDATMDVDDTLQFKEYFIEKVEGND